MKRSTLGFFITFISSCILSAVVLVFSFYALWQVIRMHFDVDPIFHLFYIGGFLWSWQNGKKLKAFYQLEEAGLKYFVLFFAVVSILLLVLVIAIIRYGHFYTALAWTVLVTILLGRMYMRVARQAMEMP